MVKIIRLSTAPNSFVGSLTVQWVLSFYNSNGNFWQERWCCRRCHSRECLSPSLVDRFFIPLLARASRCKTAIFTNTLSSFFSFLHHSHPAFVFSPTWTCLPLAVPLCKYIFTIWLLFCQHHITVYVRCSKF